MQSKSCHCTHTEEYLPPLIKETCLYNKWRASQRTTAGHGAEITEKENHDWTQCRSRGWGGGTTAGHSADHREKQPQLDTIRITITVRVPEFQEVCRGTGSPRDDCTNEIGTMVTSIEMITQKGEISQDPTPRPSTTRNYWLLGEGEVACLGDEQPFCLSNVEHSAQKSYTCKQQNISVDCTSMYLCLFDNNKSKRPSTWVGRHGRGSRKGVWRGMEGEKWQGKEIKIISIKRKH